MSRVIWVVRHAEREDNINYSWRKSTNKAKDNSPLSERGKKQADEVGVRMAREEIAHVFASPFDRTVETASRIVASRGIPIKVEPGLCEALYLCQKPPGWEDIAELKKTYPLVDTLYEPVFTKASLPREHAGDEACVPRVRRTLEELCSRYSGPLLLVGHGASIGGVHEALVGDWAYVGQATISKFVQLPDKSFRLDGDSSHLSDRTNLRPW